MLLSELNTGQSALIKKVKGTGAFRRRIMEMGFVAGKKVFVVKAAPLQDPVEYKILDYNVSLRRSEADLIQVSSGKNKALNESQCGFAAFEEQHKISKGHEKCHIINIAVVGNPNSGKTTLFNYISGLRERVGNYSGVTVSGKTAEVKLNDYMLKITDLPGTYSLTPYTEDEKVVHDFIINEIPDIVINVVDASNLERNMFLTTQLIDMDIKVIVALNIYDELEKKGLELDHELLGKMLGIPFVPTIASKQKGITELLEKVISFYNDNESIARHIHIDYGHPIEDSIKSVRTELSREKDIPLALKISPRYIALKLLEKDSDIKLRLQKHTDLHSISKVVDNEINIISEHYEDSPEDLITDAKYGFIAGAIKETLKRSKSKKSSSRLRNIDEFATHKVWGIPIFLAFMWVMFKSTFTLGQYPMTLIEYLVERTEVFFLNFLSDGILKDLIIDGIIGGVGGVLVFLPNILILFFFISFFEDTGYMSRIVFIIDKVMHKIGLHGRSFIPMIMGFGCSVPAIMATKAIKSRKNRLVTMMIIPFMSCGAKLPVYILLINAFFPDNPAFVLFNIYLFGVVVAMLSALILKKTILKGEDIPFVMELPPYRMPTFRSTAFHMWDKAYQYLKKMGGIILAASVIIWALGYFPRGIEGETNVTSQLENSYIGRLGRAIEPVFEPIGFNWKSNVAIISGFAGKELVVSSLSILHSDVEGDNLHEKLTKANTFDEDGNKKLKALSFLVFILLYVPCIATVTAIKKEANSWKWAVLSVVFTTGTAWIFSFLIYNIGKVLL